MLHLLDASLEGASFPLGLRVRVPALADRRVLHRLRGLLSNAPDPSRWGGWLRRRSASPQAHRTGSTSRLTTSALSSPTTALALT